MYKICYYKKNKIQLIVMLKSLLFFILNVDIELFKTYTILFSKDLLIERIHVFGLNIQLHNQLFL
jgi:hypothetical protein